MTFFQISYKKQVYSYIFAKYQVPKTLPDFYKYLYRKHLSMKSKKINYKKFYHSILQ